MTTMTKQNRHESEPGYIYAITCLGNGRVYIGSTVDPKSRFRGHRRDLIAGKHHSPKLQASWDKYGDICFSFEIIETVEDRLFLLAREQFWMWRYDQATLLNCASSAYSPLGSKRSQKQRSEHSEFMKARSASPEGKAHLARMHEKLRGRYVSQEERAMRSRALKGKDCGREWTPEARAAHSKVMAGRKMPPVSDETKRKISAANTGKKRSPEAVANAVAARIAFIKIELPEWRRLREEGKSFREIEEITGRCRDIISRELRKDK